MEKAKLILAVTTLLGAGLIGAASLHRADRRTPDIIRYVAINNSDEVIQLLNSEPSQVRALDVDGSTPLHVAAYRGYPDMVKLLIDNGAEIDRPDKHGFTPLAEAVLAGGQPQTRRAIVTSLLRAGANPRFTLPDGRTVIDLAISLRGPRSHLADLLRGDSAKCNRRFADAAE
jgi:ankyrin repeat protein